MLSNDQETMSHNTVRSMATNNNEADTTQDPRKFTFSKILTELQTH